MEKRRRKKIAICGFNGRVCSRFDASRKILLLDGEDPAATEEVNIAFVEPEKKVEVLAQMGVKVIIVGGMQDRLQEMSSQSDMEVIWGVMGPIQEVAEAYFAGQLYPGIGPVSGGLGKPGKEK